MRTALATLIAAGLVSAAQAQQPAAPAAPVATTTPPPAAPAAPASTPAAAPATAPAATPAPAPAAAAPAPTSEAPPTLPTSGDGAVIINVIEKICVPLVRGGDLNALAKTVPGMKYNKRDDVWTMPLGGDRNYTLTIFSPGSNKNVCRGEVHYALGQDAPIVSALNIWSFLHQPELILQANYVSTNADGLKRVQKSWEHLDTHSSIAVNFTTVSNPDDTPVNSRYATGELFYQERTF